MTVHLNKKHVLFQVETSGSSQNIFFSYNQKKQAKQSSNRHFWNVINVVLESWWFPFGEIAPYFSEILYENHQNNSMQYETMKTTFPKKSKSVFISIRYRKTFQTQDIKSQSTERRVPKLAQPKRGSAFEPETHFVSSGEMWASSQNSFFNYNQSNKPTRAQKDNFGTYSTSFWKVSVLLKKQELF